MELAAFLWALGSVPVAMAGGGTVALGPQPWLLVPVGPLQIFVGAGEPRIAGRIHLITGPWFAWLDLPPPRFAVGRAIGPAWLALVRGLDGLHLAWEVMASSHLALFGALGDENACGIRFRWTHVWAAALIRHGGLTLWCGVYF